ncbi:MAG: hypothetical protein R6U38_09130 [Desulfatiglandaceae bacterium]
MASPIHYVPGRLRIRIPLLKSQPDEKVNIETLFTEIEGMEKIVLNEITGSVVFTYDPGALNRYKILDILSENGYLQEDTAHGASTQKRYGIGSQTSHVIGRSLFGMAVKKALEPTGLSFIAALI